METTDKMYTAVSRCFLSFADTIGIVRRKRMSVLSRAFHDMADAFPVYKRGTEKLHEVVRQGERISIEIGARHQHNVVERYATAGMFSGWNKK